MCNGANLRSRPSDRGLRCNIPANEEDDAALYGEEPVVQGDFTWRAVLVGLGVGVILCMTNIYFGLQTGA